MENSFKRNLTYKKTDLPNGYVEYSFKSRRMAGHLRGMEWVKISLLWIVSAILTAWIVFKILPMGIAFISWFVIMGAVYLFMDRTESKITVDPHQGLIFSGKTIPFAEITNILPRQNMKARELGKEGLVKDNTESKSHYIAVETHGVSVPISASTTWHNANDVAACLMGHLSYYVNELVK